MRIAEGLRVQQLGVLAHLRCGVQAGAGVVQIDVPVRVQSSVLGRAQRVEMQRGPVVEGSARETPRTRRTAVSDSRSWLG